MKHLQLQMDEFTKSLQDLREQFNANSPQKESTPNSSVISKINQSTVKTESPYQCNVKAESQTTEDINYHSYTPHISPRAGSSADYPVDLVQAVLGSKAPTITLPEYDPINKASWVQKVVSLLSGEPYFYPLLN